MKASDEQYLRERILPIFNALAVLQVKGLPADFDHFKPVIDIYETDNDHPAYDWETKLGNKDEAWIITHLHYSKCGAIRTTSRGRSWNSRRGRQEKKLTNYSSSDFPEDLKIFAWKEDLYNLREKNKGQAANGDQGHSKYTMHEHTPKEDKPRFALCKISLNKEAAQKRQPQKFHPHKDPKTEDGCFTKFEKGETSCSGPMEQGCDYKHSNGQYRTAHERRGIQEIADKIDELGQYCSKSHIIEKVLSFLDLLVVPNNAPDNAVPRSSSRIKRTTPAPMNNKYKRYSSSTSTKERCMNENGTHLTIELKAQNPCNSFQMVEMNPHQNSNQMNSPIITSLPTIPQAPKPGEINPNTMEQGSPRCIAVQQTSTRVAASTNVFTSTALHCQHIGGQNSTMMNIPTNKSFHPIPEASRYGDMNPNTTEQQVTAGMVVCNNGFMGMIQQNVGQNSPLLQPINNSLHTSPEFPRFGKMNPDTFEQGSLSSIPGMSVGARMTVFPDGPVNTTQQNVGPNSIMMNLTNGNYPSTILDGYPVETNPHEMEQSSLGPISVEPAGFAAPSNGFTSTGTARQTGGSNSLIYSSGNNDHDCGFNGFLSDFLKLDDNQWFNWKDENLR